MQSRQIQLRAAYGACGVIVICAAGMFFGSEYRIGAMMAAQAVVALCLTYDAMQAYQKKARHPFT